MRNLMLILVPAAGGTATRARETGVAPVREAEATTVLLS